jgi:hypothetical protein
VDNKPEKKDHHGDTIAVVPALLAVVHQGHKCINVRINGLETQKARPDSSLNNNIL